MNQELIKTNGGAPQGAVIQRQEFGAQQVQSQAETAMAAVTAREQAAIQSRYVMAERHPRNWDGVRVRVLGHCDRPRFAEVAKYRKPVGKKFINGEWREQHIEGLSARFAEMAAQEMSNIYEEAPVTFEDDLIRIVRASVTDLERNLTYAQEVAVAKAVERKGRKKGDEWVPPEGREVLSQRINSYGDPVFLVKATDDEVRNKQASEVSKAQRNFVLKLVPRDIQEEALDKINATLADPKKVDPTEAKKRIVDSFAKVGIMPDDLMNYIGHSLEMLQPADLEELRGLYTAIRDGEATFQDALRTKFDTPLNTEPGAPGDETRQQHDIRLQRQMAKQAQQATARTRIEKLKGTKPTPEDSGADAPDPHAHLTNMADFPSKDACDDREVVKVKGVLYRFSIETGEFQQVQ